MGILDMLLGPVQSQSSPQDMSSALGMDPKEWQAIAAQFSPSDADKRAALKHSLLTAGLGILADRSGNPYRAIGSGGLLGVGSYNQELQQLNQQRAQNMGAIMPALQFAQKMKMAQNFAGNDSGALPAPAGPPSATYLGASGAMPSLSPTNANAATLATLQQPPPGLPSLNGGSNLNLPNWRDVAPRDARLTAAMSMDPKLMLETVNKYSETKMGPDGTVMTTTGIPLYKQGPRGTTFYNRDGTPAKFVPNPAAADQAEATQAANIAAATTTAQEAARNPFQIGEYTDSNNVVHKGYLPQLFGQPPVGGAQQQAPRPNVPSGYAGGSRASADAGRVAILQDELSRATNPNDVAALNKELAMTSVGQPAQGGGMVGPNPVQQAELTAQATGRGKNSADYEQAVHDAATNAVQNEARLGEMRKVMDRIPFGAYAPTQLNIAKFALPIPLVGESLANLAAPNAASAVPAMQVFNKSATNMVIEQSKQLGTREAAQVIQMVANANPNIAWTKDAAATVMDYLSGGNKWAMEREKAFTKWKGSPSEFQADWNANHPLSDYIPPLDKIREVFQPESKAQASGQIGTGNKTVDALVKKYANR